MNTYPSFETERLLLRPTDHTDAAFILALLNSPKWKQNIGDRQVHTTEEAKQYIADKMLPQLERLGFGNYTLITKEGNQKIGTCGLYHRETLQGVDIGFALLPTYEGKGYAFEAAQLLMQLAQEHWNLPLVQGITIESNTTSRRLLEKLGLEFIEYTRLPNDPVELMLYRRVF